MMFRLMRWLRDPLGKRDEKSNSIALFIVLLPIIIGAFGLGVDVARNLYIRTSLQNSLDMAVVGGSGVTTTDGNNQIVLGVRHGGVIDRNAVVTEVERVYAMNRMQGPGLSCVGRGTVPGTRLQKCWEQPTTPVVTSNFVYYSVAERSRNAFLQILSDDLIYQHYTLESRATITRVN
jgi:hypothetical protein